MKTDIAEAWCQELESGRWQKGRGLLHRMAGEEVDEETDKFCCLGVLCRMALRAGIDVTPRVLNATTEEAVGDGLHVKYGHGRCNARLPDEVKQWAGMWSSMGHLPGRAGAELGDLTVLNDTTKGFGEVAQAIRQHMHAL